MRSIKLFIGALALLFTQLAFAQQDSVPFIKGNVNISITKGTIDCDFIMKSMPRIQDYVIRINSGMNIHNFKNLKAGNLLYFERDKNDTTSSGETLAYYFPGNKGKGKFLPQELQLKYVGMYPVITDTTSVEDWRGNIAFNGYSLRAEGLQSAWYPVLYDLKKQVRYEKVKYDLNINCADCSTIYLNGNPPVKGTHAEFKSDIPTQLVLFCGNYDFVGLSGAWLLNSGFDKVQQQQFGDMIKSFQKYYLQNLGIPYKGDIAYIQTTPTAKDYAFAFNADPTVINIGSGKYSLKTYFDKGGVDFNKHTTAHELGHYYFGTYLRPNSYFGPVINESFTEFLAFKVTKKLISDSAYTKQLNDKIRAMKNFQPLPVSKIRKEEDFRNRELYVYYYVPVVLLAVEKEVGEKAMWKWLRTMLNTPTDFTDYAFLEKTFMTSFPQKDAERIKAKYFDSNEALKNAVSEVQSK